MADTADNREVQYFDSDFSYEDHALEHHQKQWGGDNNTKLTENDEALLPQSQSEYWDKFHSHHSAGNFYKARRYLTKSFPCILQYFTTYTQPQGNNNANDGDGDQEDDIQQRTTTQKKRDRDDVRIILEIGCGSGSSCIPILNQCAEMEECSATIEEENGIDIRRILIACDSSSVAVETTQRYIAKFIEKEKETADDTKRKSFDILFDAFVADPSLSAEETDISFLHDVTATYEKLMSKEDDQQPDSTTVKFEKGIAGIVVMVFVLSAVTPPRVDRFLEQVYETTSPGGLVCFRDYGLYDMPMLRFDNDANVTCSTEMSEDQVFVRGEGTIARKVHVCTFIL